MFHWPLFSLVIASLKSSENYTKSMYEAPFASVDLERISLTPFALLNFQQRVKKNCRLSWLVIIYSWHKSSCGLNGCLEQQNIRDRNMFRDLIV